MRSKHPIDFPHLVLLLAKWIPLASKEACMCSISCRRRINHRLAYGNIGTKATQCTTPDMKGTSCCLPSDVTFNGDILWGFI
jgi:hypothetical protein